MKNRLSKVYCISDAVVQFFMDWINQSLILYFLNSSVQFEIVLCLLYTYLYKKYLKNPKRFWLENLYETHTKLAPKSHECRTTLTRHSHITRTTLARHSHDTRTTLAQHSHNTHTKLARNSYEITNHNSICIIFQSDSFWIFQILFIQIGVHICTTT